MTSFMDIAPSHRKVALSFGEVDVPGLPLDGLVGLAQRHPKLLELFNGGELNGSLPELMSLGLDVMASVIAAGLGYPDDDAAIERVKKLSPGDAWLAAETILEVSFPGGPKSFFEKVQAALGKVGIRAAAPETAVSSDSPSSANS